jgi:hypothetical protein
MPLFNNPFRPKKADKEITSLNLENPKPKSSPSDPSASFPQVDPKFLTAAKPEVERRAKQMLDAGKRPKDLYLAIDATHNELIVYRTNTGKNTLLIFTSGRSARDYMKTTTIEGGVHWFAFESLPAYIERWRKEQADYFVLDRCPRCPRFAAINLEGITQESFLVAWAVHKATRSFQAERIIRAYLDTSDSKKDTPATKPFRREKRQLLEILRDHIDCNVPYVHWLIALDAGMDGDEEVRTAAIQSLEAFWPEFKDKVAPGMSSGGDTDAWVKSVSEAHLGLLGTFGMLRPDLQSAVKETAVNLPTPPHV